MSAHDTSDLPLVAVVCGLGSAGPLEITRAAQGVCDLIFLLCRDDVEFDAWSPFVSELGPHLVVDDSVLGQTVEALQSANAAGIVTFSESKLVIAASLAAATGLRHNSPSTVQNIRSKSRQRRVLADRGVDHLPSYVAYDRDAARRILRDGLEAPLVIKPERGTGSRSTFLARSAAEAEGILAQLSGAHYKAGIVLESYIEGDPDVAGTGLGDYVSVESVTLNGRTDHFAVTGRTALARPFRETGLFWPSTLSDAWRSCVRDYATRVLQALEITDGITHTEIKLTTAGPRLIEVNGRLGGYVADVLRRSGVPDPVRIALQACLGHKVDVVEEPEAHVAFAWQCPAPEGRTVLRGIRGVDGARRIQGVSEIRLSARIDQVLDTEDGLHSMIYEGFGVATSHTSMMRTIENVRLTIDPDLE